MKIKTLTENGNPSDLSCFYEKRLLNKVCQLNAISKAGIDTQVIAKAIRYAKIWHGKQRRESGELYYSHPLEVAYMASDYCFNTDIIVTAILHDTIEDTIATQEVINDIFGPTVSKNVIALTRFNVGGNRITAAQIIDRLFDQGNDDLLIVKLFDRVHNIRTIGAKSYDSAKKVIEETLGVFVDLANYLGMSDVGNEMLSICQQYLITNQNTISKYNLEKCEKLDNYTYY